ncbi:hypothetical protein AMTRI_Chr06g192590 [Amborella trichopoda]
MADDFKIRVSKAFGSLFQSLPSLSSLSPQAWSLNDDAVEKREWSRDEPDEARENIPCSSFFDEVSGRERRRIDRKARVSRDAIEDDLEAIDEEEMGEASKGCDEEEYRALQKDIGRDSTLDREDEEDEFDRVAVGRENASERLYMRDVTDTKPHINSHNEGNITRHPQANHFAAKKRLKEDDDEAARERVKKNKDGVHDMEDDTHKPEKETKQTVETMDTQPENTKEAVEVKPILKRQRDQANPESRKRVRFDPNCKLDLSPSNENTDVGETTLTTKTSAVRETSSSNYTDARVVPDYIRNPSKYIHYTLDWSNQDDENSNLNAFQETVNLSSSEGNCEAYSMKSPAPVTFMPKKKMGNAKAMKESSDTRSESEGRFACPVVIAASDTGESEVCSMEEDEMEVERERTQRGERRYRSKVSSDVSVLD